jgi:hypothetical protein
MALAAAAAQPSAAADDGLLPSYGVGQRHIIPGVGGPESRATASPLCPGAERR